jgi:sialate O-acetylesterase
MKTEFRLAAVFSDHMVLCRNRPARLFGTAEDGQKVTATVAGRTACVTARGGRFELALPPISAGGPYELSVTDGESELKFSDVYFGEVYLAGGQSNMEMELKDAGGGPEQVAGSDLPLIRYYNVPKCPWIDETALAAERETCWKLIKPGECGDISAVAFYFAKRLQAELGVAVGIVDCYWGGTSVTCWMDESALRATPEGAALLGEFNAAVDNKTQAECDEDVRLNNVDMDAWNAHVEDLRIHHPELSWTEINARVGVCPWGPPPNRRTGFRPAGLVETMVKRVAPYTLTGILYYQGEEDTKHAGLYRALMTTLILHWRKLFDNEELPFLFVQLPMYKDSADRDDRQWAVLREAQALTALSVGNTGLVVMIDGGELDNIHPADKKTVGDRLFDEAMRVAYGRAADTQAPRALSLYRDGAALVILLSAPVTAEGEPKLFEVADVSGVFVPAKATLAGNTVRVSAEGVSEPVAARYAWTNYDIVNVFGKNGMPLAPFRLR